MKRFLQAVTGLIFFGVMTASGLASDIPELKGRVNDYAGLLSQAEQNQLTAALHDLEDKTTAQVAILTVKQPPKGEDMNSFKNKVFKDWKLGQKGKDNGILIVYAATADDGKDHYGIEVGYGLESVIPDAAAGDIIRHRLRAHADPKNGTHDFHAAFSGAVQVISEKIVAAANVQKAEASKPDEPKGATTILIIVGALAFVAFVVFALVGFSGRSNTSDSEESDSSRRRKPLEEDRHKGQRRGRPIPAASSQRESKRRDTDDDSLLTGVAVGAALSGSRRSSDDGPSYSSSSDSSPSFDSGGSFGGGGGESGGGGASD